MKTFLRILTAPIWLPFYALVYFFGGIPVFLIWMTSDLTWSQSWDEVL